MVFVEEVVHVVVVFVEEVLVEVVFWSRSGSGGVYDKGGGRNFRLLFVIKLVEFFNGIDGSRSASLLFVVVTLLMVEMVVEVWFCCLM